NSLLIKVDCSGGEFGVVRQFCGINPGKQGKVAGFTVNGKSAYPDGKGEMLRIERGLNAEKEDPALSCMRIILGVMTLGFMILLQKPAKTFFALPRNVAEQSPPHASPETGVLWTIPQELAPRA